MFTESLIKIIPSKRDPSGRIKVETPVHHPRNRTLIAETVAGPIYRMSFPPENTVYWEEDVEVPQFLLAATDSTRGRKALSFALHTNSKRIYNKECNKEIGKPNSAFIGLRDNMLIVDHLFENESFERKDASKLHDIISRNVNYLREFQRIQQNVIILSGHLAPLNISTKSAAYIVLLDCFMGKNSYHEHSLGLKYIINLMYGARIIPVTSDGYLIKLDSKKVMEKRLCAVSVRAVSGVHNNFVSDIYK